MIICSEVVLQLLESFDFKQLSNEDSLFGLQIYQTLLVEYLYFFSHFPLAKIDSELLLFEVSSHAGLNHYYCSDATGLTVKSYASFMSRVLTYRLRIEKAPKKRVWMSHQPNASVV